MDLFEAFSQAGLIAKMTLLVGFAPLAFAVAYAVRPEERILALLRPVSLVVVFAAICGVAAGFVAVLRGVAATLPKPVGTMPNLYIGLSEALVPMLVNFGVLAVSWVLVVVGMLRRQRSE
jgi:hypothetical protein